MILKDIYKQLFKINIFLSSRIYQEKYLPILEQNETSFFNKYSIINDPYILKTIKKICFTKKDVRAGWFGKGLPKTDKKEYQNFADWATEHLMIYESFLPYCDKNSKCILDIGCGIGYATLGLTNYFSKATIIGLDYDEEAIFVAKTFNRNPAINYLNEDFFNYKNRETFDYIFALEVLEHLPASKHYLFIEKALKMLSSGGKLFISTPNALDEKDSDYGHIGLLNRRRAQLFIKKYHDLIYKGFFINNKMLLTKDPKQFVVKKKINDFNSNQSLSHFHLILKNKE